MQEEVEYLRSQWLLVYSLSKEVIEQSDYPSGSVNRWEWKSSLDWQEIEKAKTFRRQAALLRFFLNEQFKSWEINIDIWTEYFWQKAYEARIERDRKEPLRKVLERRKFSGIGQAMHTRYEWVRLRQSGFLQKRYSEQELNVIEDIIAVDEEKRLVLLKKCLRLRRIPLSNYREYGDAIAYFTRGKLFNEPVQDSLLAKHFSNEETKTLDSIWDQYHILAIQRRNNLT